jgi:large conductance mechanosensitive channel
MWEAFKKFAFRGNVVDLAVGVIIGAAFSKIVNTLVDGIIMPPVGMLLRRIDFSNLFFILDRSRPIPRSLADAKANSIPVIAYGQLITDMLSFTIVAAVVFVIVRELHKYTERPQPTETTKACPYCFTVIPLRSTRCASCTSHLEPEAVPTASPAPIEPGSVGFGT